MNAVAKKYQPVEDPHLPKPKRRRPILLFFLILTILGFYAHWEGVDFLVVDEYGNFQLSPQRKKEFNDRLQRIGQAEQYKLTATEDGYYPCYSCGQDSTIFLFKGETWKYGVTFQNSSDRYSTSWLKRMKLNYKTEYEGLIDECLKEEAYKIYHYPTEPENVKRHMPLIRPPGNKVDR